MSENVIDPTEFVYKAGTQLVVEGDRSRKMFIIKKGRARVFKNYLQQRITLAVIGEGEVFGELSFFDAAPRCASVEALTELTVLVFDGNATAKQIAGIPQWIFPILRTTFSRFRAADEKIAVLQCMNEYKKKAFKTDNVAQTVYMELQRFIKTLKLLYEHPSPHFKDDSAKFYTELDGLLSSRTLGLKTFWKQLKEYDFIDLLAEEETQKIKLNVKGLDDWYNYLSAEISQERFLMLSHSSIAILRKIVTTTEGPNEKSNPEHELEMDLDLLGVSQVSLHEEGLKELVSKKILAVAENSCRFKPTEIHHHFLYQELLKPYDHSTVSLD